MTPDTLAALVAARQAGRTTVLATRLSDGVQAMFPAPAGDGNAHFADMPRLVEATVKVGLEEATLELGLAEATSKMGLAEAASQALQQDRSSVHDIAGVAWFLHVHAPPFRLVVIGAVHIAQALVTLARAMGYEVTVIDPRRAFNSAERFADATRVHAWPDEAVAALAPDARMAVVALTHDPKLDDPALDQALRRDTGYIGALGSRRSHAARLARLAELGHGPEALGRVRGPVGLALGAVSASEIAVSILAEIVAVRRGAALGRRQ